jgi:hypothetical protein
MLILRSRGHQFLTKKLPPGKREFDTCQPARYLHIYNLKLFNYFYVKFGVPIFSFLVPYPLILIVPLFCRKLRPRFFSYAQT